jgi:hypothetical protein
MRHVWPQAGLGPASASIDQGGRDTNARMHRTRGQIPDIDSSYKKQRCIGGPHPVLGRLGAKTLRPSAPQLSFIRQPIPPHSVTIALSLKEHLGPCASYLAALQMSVAPSVRTDVILGREDRSRRHSRPRYRCDAPLHRQTHNNCGPCKRSKHTPRCCQCAH